MLAVALLEWQADNILIANVHHVMTRTYTRGSVVSRSIRSKSKCAFCGDVLTTSNASKEHVLPNAIGGHKTVQDFICGQCNSLVGRTWDAELAKQLQPLCTLLDIKRSRGTNRNLRAKTIRGVELEIRPDGSKGMAKPEITKRTVADRTEVNIRARSMQDLRQIVSGMAAKNTNIDLEATLAKATSKHEYISDPIEFDGQIGGTLAGRSIVKSCLALACEAGVEADQCEHAMRYLLSDGEPCFGYFYESDLVKNRPDEVFFHCVYVQGDPLSRQILAYVEYFGAYRIVACLSSRYSGPEFATRYAIDPLGGSEVKVDVDLNLAPEDIGSLYAYEKCDAEAMQTAFERIYSTLGQIDLERATQKAVERAWKYACETCGVVEGEEWTQEQKGKFFGALWSQLEPFLLHVLRGRKFTEEDLQIIAARMGDLEGQLRLEREGGVDGMGPSDQS